MNSKNIDLKIFLAAIGVSIALGVACTQSFNPRKADSDSTPISEIAGAVIAGANNATWSSGTQAKSVQKKSTMLAKVESYLTLLPKAHGASSQGGCATVQSGINTIYSTCVTSGSTLTIIYTPCNLADPTAVWSGSQTLAKSAGPTVFPTPGPGTTCGGFPTFTNGDVVVRTFGAPTSRINMANVAVLLDTSNTISGYNTRVTSSGETITFSGAVSRTIQVNGIHLVAQKGNFPVWDYTITSDPFSFNGANNQVGSNVVVSQDNRRMRTATSTITGTTYSAGCCTPTAGSVTTTFSDGSSSETLTYTATCGVAQLNGKTFTLSHCF
jgi:hypothetical protein